MTTEAPAPTTASVRPELPQDMTAAVMYAPGKVLYAGGGTDSVFSRDTLATPTASAEVIDLN